MAIKFFVKHEDFLTLRTNYDALTSTKRGIVVTIDFAPTGGKPNMNIVTAKITGAVDPLDPNNGFDEANIEVAGPCPYPPPC
jgi:hypothetical protein